ncbi:glycosyltransferase [Clostridium butyricum]|uniref:Spore coat protein SA n=1 Tax=Clostridium butyricum TaxID=1492 RepID=A0A6N3BUI1_CLOBU
MKIAIITPGSLPVPPIKGGAVENLIYNIISENECSKKGIDIDVFSIVDKGINVSTLKEKKTNYFFIKKEEHTNKLTEFIKIKLRSKFNYSPFVKDIIKLIGKTKYDYIVVENRPEYVIELSKKTDRKIILHMHNEHLTTYKNYQKVIDYCYKIIVVSKYIKSTIISKYNIEEAKICVLNNGINVDRFSKPTFKEKQYFRKKYNLLENDFVVLFSGRLIKEKGILELIKSIYQCNSIDNLKLVIVGANWFSSNIRDEFTEKLKHISNEISNKIIFTGYIDYEKIHEVYKTADIAVLPSIFNDPFPLTVLECMAVGIPIISTNSGGIPEMINKDYGIILSIDKKLVKSLAESINYLFINEDMRYCMGNKARLNAENNYSLKVFYDKFIEILD